LAHYKRKTISRFYFEENPIASKKTIEMKKIALAADHAGYYMKELAADFLKKEGYEVKDFGTNSSASADYPDFAHKLGDAIDNGEFKTGFVFCGSGNGINMTVNKHQKVRSGLCWNTEIARLARLHNDANVCAIPARYIPGQEILDIIKIFLETEFEGDRHTTRVNKIPIS